MLAVHFSHIQDLFQNWSSSFRVIIHAFAVVHHVLQPLLCFLWVSDVNSYCCFVCIDWSLFASSKYCGTVAGIGTVLRVRTLRHVVCTEVSALICSVLE